ncbi:MAG: hypothetical protein IPP82_11780 [Xanthomonadales bacterium]|nr:hypothetical protein [Xanthomonadales bacterium]
MKNILACSIAMAGSVAAGSVSAQTCTASAGAIALSGPNSLTTPITNFDTCGVSNQLNCNVQLRYARVEQPTLSGQLLLVQAQLVEPLHLSRIL